jgi:hypothetical protein
MYVLNWYEQSIALLTYSRMAGGVCMVTVGLTAAYRVPDDKEHAGLRPFIIFQVRRAHTLSSTPHKL